MECAAAIWSCVLVGVGTRRLELQEQPVRLDAALVLRLIVERLGERVHDATRELVAARLLQEAVHVLGAVLLVFHEHRDEVLQRFGLELGELAARALARPLLGGLEHLEKAPRRLLGLAEAPERPGALEEREVVELGVRVLEDFFVLAIGVFVVGCVLGELVFGAHHVRVGHEATLREPLEDLVEATERLIVLALLAREKAVDVERQVVLRKRLVVLEHAQEARARLLVVLNRRVAAPIGGDLLPLLEFDEERFARFFPLELADSKQRFRQLRRRFLGLVDELLEQRVRFAAQRAHLREVTADTLVDLSREHAAKRGRDLQAHADVAPIVRSELGLLLDRGAAFRAELALGSRLDARALARHRRSFRLRFRGEEPRGCDEGEEEDRGEDPRAHQTAC